jgi:hypothetical protein
MLLLLQCSQIAIMSENDPLNPRSGTDRSPSSKFSSIRRSAIALQLCPHLSPSRLRLPYQGLLTSPELGRFFVGLSLDVRKRWPFLMIRRTAPILSLLNWDPLCTRLLISDLNLIRTCELDLSNNSPSLNSSLKDKLTSEFSRLQSKLNDLKTFLKKRLKHRVLLKLQRMNLNGRVKWFSELII